MHFLSLTAGLHKCLSQTSKSSQIDSRVEEENTLGPSHRKPMKTKQISHFEPIIWSLQRVSALVLAWCTIIHLIVIITSVQKGLTAASIIDRIGGNGSWFIFYTIFVLAASIHAPIGIRIVLKEWTKVKEAQITLLSLGFGAFLATLGMWSVWGVYSLGRP